MVLLPVWFQNIWLVSESQTNWVGTLDVLDTQVLGWCFWCFASSGLIVLFRYRYLSVYGYQCTDTNTSNTSLITQLDILVQRMFPFARVKYHVDRSLEVIHAGHSKYASSYKYMFCLFHPPHGSSGVMILLLKAGEANTRLAVVPPFRRYCIPAKSASCP